MSKTTPTYPERDRFGNFRHKFYNCPRCGSEWLTYVGQFDSHLCDDCDWSEPMFSTNTKMEPLDYTTKRNWDPCTNPT